MQAKVMNLITQNFIENIDRFEGPLYLVSLRMYYNKDGNTKLCVGCCDKHLLAQSDRVMKEQRYRIFNYSELLLYNNTKLSVKLNECQRIANDAADLEYEYTDFICLLYISHLFNKFEQ